LRWRACTLVFRRAVAGTLRGRRARRYWCAQWTWSTRTAQVAQMRTIANLSTLSLLRLMNSRLPYFSMTNWGWQRARFIRSSVWPMQALTSSTIQVLPACMSGLQQTCLRPCRTMFPDSWLCCFSLLQGGSKFIISMTRVHSLFTNTSTEIKNEEWMNFILEKAANQTVELMGNLVHPKVCAPQNQTQNSTHKDCFQQLKNSWSVANGLICCLTYGTSLNFLAFKTLISDLWSLWMSGECRNRMNELVRTHRL
jgi:hypothetical protein